jgi:GH15 family glucan-1,4-alpha-glucosidase
MCWVALDRAISLAPLLGDGAHVDEWSAQRDAVRNAVLADGWSDRAGAYTGAFGSDDLDASGVAPTRRRLPSRPRRADVATVEAVERSSETPGWSAAGPAIRRGS